MGDLISRQAAIDLIRSMESDATSHGISPRLTPSHVINGIESLPSAERPIGKWIDAVIPNDNGDLLVQVCDQCNTFFPLAYTGGGHHYCPNCGADMRGEKDD